MHSCRPDGTMTTLIAAVGVVVTTVVAHGTARSSEVWSATGSIVAGAGAAGDAIRIWKVGSPHRGEIPPTTLPPALAREATRRGFRLSIEAFPATGFATTFFDAVARGAAPDLLVFDNFGVMQGITTALGHFDGIGQDPSRKPLTSKKLFVQSSIACGRGSQMPNCSLLSTKIDSWI